MDWWGRKVKRSFLASLLYLIRGGRGIRFGGDKPAPNSVFALIPETPDLRENPAYVLTPESVTNGRFQIAGVILGDSYLFFVPANKGNGYLGLQFADRNLSNSTDLDGESEVGRESGYLVSVCLGEITGITQIR